MRVLDIDLDFFLADTCPLAAPGRRPCLEGHEPWPKAEVRRFLERNLGLDRRSPVPGRVFETHDGALGYWDGLIRAGRLGIPFEVTHVDAHSDLGIGYPGPGIVLKNALCQNIDARRRLERHYGLGHRDEANYLLFALAFRWVSSLENLRNPRSKRDLPPEIVHTRDENGAATELKLTPPLGDLFERLNGVEPVISYRQYDDAWQYVNALAYDFMSLAVSPRYAPKEADALIGTITEYMAADG